MKKNNLFVILIVLVLFFISLNYSSIDNFLEKSLVNEDFVFVNRVIDGDTIKTGNQSVRLLGINTPEKGEKYYSEAKEYLENLILNKTVRLEYGKEKYDQYHRILAYVYLNRENVNQKLVEEGFANLYFYDKDLNYNNFKNAWNDCILDNKNLCEKSKDKCADCIKLVEFDYENEKVVFENNCGFDCDLTNWEIKDEGRKHFSFPSFVLENLKKVSVIVGEGKNTNEVLYWNRKDYVWTDTGDTLFLRDDLGKLVLWESY